MNTKKSLCFSFVCQPGELELKALLLGASLRLHNPKWTEDKVELVAALPDQSIWGTISDVARNLFDELGIRLQTTPSCFGREYPIGNKISALGVETSAQTTVFLDSDILCLGTIDENMLLTDGIKAKPADLNTFCGHEDQWEIIYQSFSLPVPEKNTVTTVNKQAVRPYFNAGVIAVANASRFSDCWLDTANSLDANKGIINKRPWLDQVALPVAAARSGLTISPLDETYNYPAHLRCLDTTRLPVLCHYHGPDVIAGEKQLMDTLSRLVARHPLLSEKIEEEPGWLDVKRRLELWKESGTAARDSKVDLSGRNFLITGIPRSGTSLLTHLLGNMDNTVVINEPEEVFSLLADERMAWNLPVYYRTLRRNIILGRDVKNKVDRDGKPVQDTFKQNDDRIPWRPEITSEEFWLGTKNPLAYLARLPLLCRHYPEMPFIAMIRHPVTTISSWKKSFPHLMEADLDRMPFTAANDSFNDEFQKIKLQDIRQEQDVVTRQAKLWAYLAELVWNNRHDLTIVKYEELVASPLECLKNVASVLGMREPDAKLVVGIRQETSLPDINEQEKEVINSVCAQMMQKWAYK